VWVATSLADKLDDTKACLIQLHTHYPLLYRGKETNRQFHEGTVEMVLEALPVMIRIPGHPKLKAEQAASLDNWSNDLS
jgi:hypothetical protein